MKIKGRRQSDNVVDIRQPREAVKHELNQRAQNPLQQGVEIAVNDYLARGVQDTFGREAAAMEMLLGPRWKD